jgi:hypothetical protein
MIYPHPLKPGRRSMRDQAHDRGEPVPVGRTVAQLRIMGYDTDPDWPDDGALFEDENSPTGYAIRFRAFDEGIALWSLAH